MSEKFVILPDVTCDLKKEIREKYDIEFVPGHIYYPSGVEERSMLDWSECSFIEEKKSEAFYNELRKDPDGFSTAPPNIQEFYDAFEKYVSQGIGVLTLTISSGMSGTFSFASKAKEMIMEKYPNAKISCIDTLRFGPGFGLIAVYASILRSEGKTLEEVTDYLDKNMNRFHQMGWLDDLSFVAKKGRLSHAKAFMGKLVGVKPLGEFDYNGMTTVIGKAKGEKSAYKAIMSYIENTIEEPQEQIIFIAHTNRREKAEQLRQMIEERFHPKATYLNDVFPACGINVGPGLMAAYYYGKPITKDLEDEKKLITQILANG